MRKCTIKPGNVIFGINDMWACLIISARKDEYTCLMLWDETDDHWRGIHTFNSIFLDLLFASCGNRVVMEFSS